MDHLKSRYASNLWSVLKAIPVSTFIFEDGKLVLKESELSVYLYLCLLANKQRSNCEVSVTIAELEERTGYGHAQVERGLKRLREKKFIGQTEVDIRDKTGRFSRSEYVMTHPKSGKSLSQQKSDNRRQDTALGAALFYEKQPYFQAPEHVTEMLGRLRGTPLAAYVARLTTCEPAWEA
jgi:predicted transcriptional regulator